MKKKLTEQHAQVLFIPHGGGPLPLLDDEGHQELIHYLKILKTKLEQPSAIIVVSAHWEEEQVTITSGAAPSLIYDYYGFPDESYEIEYPVPGAPLLAEKIYKALQNNGIGARLDEYRGFDHGLFVPLKIMFPEAKIPCVQLSLINTLDPQTHINIGKALNEIKEENVLIIGSGFSFHNLKEFVLQDSHTPDSKNESFENWLIDTCTNKNISEIEREERLVNWRNAPFARYCHPREEHLLPLHVCYGASKSAARLEFNGRVLGKKTSGYSW